jgi:EAL domain-containing protein (putative c-di-GMP-specific phosphodiesterase class I)
MAAQETLRRPRATVIRRIVDLVRGAEADSVCASCLVSGRDEEAAEPADTAALVANLEMVFQPVFELDAGGVVAFEALARFPAHAYRTTEECFAAAAAAGESVFLELAAVRAALEHLHELPDGVLLSVNVSAEVAVTPEFEELAAPVADRLIIELTEHEPVHDYREVAAALSRLRALGARLAIDDVGAGYASLRHILQLAPDIVKLDLSLTREIDSDSSRRALTTALVGFAEVIGSTIAAEGIESEGELALLRELGVVHGQGFHLGYPSPLEERLH